MGGTLSLHSMNLIKLGLLRQSCMSPGFSTLIANLFYTSDPLPLSCFDKLYISPSPHSHQSLVMKLLISRHNSLSLILLALQDLDKLYINPSPHSHQNLVIQSGMHGYFVSRTRNTFNL